MDHLGIDNFIRGAGSVLLLAWLAGVAVADLRRRWRCR